MDAKKQVLSFKEFVFESFKNIMEAEGDEKQAGITELSGVLTGGLKLMGESKSRAEKLINDYLSTYFKGFNERSEEFVTAMKDGIDMLSNEEKGVSIKNAVVTSKSMMNTYNNLIFSTVRVKGHPDTTANGDSVGSGALQRVDDTEVLTVQDLLSRIACHNASVFVNSVEDAMSKEYKAKNVANYGKESNEKSYEKYPDKYLVISEESIKSDILQVVPYENMFGMGGTQYGFSIPMTVVQSTTKMTGDIISAESIEKVLPPTESSTEVNDKPFGTSGVSYFKENEVAITEEGKLQTNMIISQFNSISKIVVNGGASSKPTSRPGGNDKLAKDRQAAGINLLKAMQKEGVVQLKGTAITAGKAETQKAAAQESDPAFQQVSFVISGMIKGQDVTNEPEVVTEISKTKADSLKFRQITINIPIQGDLDKLSV